MLQACPDGVIVASLVAPEDRKSPASASAILGAASWLSATAAVTQRHTRTAVVRWLDTVRHASNIGAVV